MIIDLKQNLMLPTPWGLSNGSSFALGNFGLTSAGHKCALVFAAPKNGVIEELGLMVGSVTSGATLDLRIETLDAAGDPSGTLVAGGANVNLAISTGDANTWKTATIGTPPTVTRGQMLAYVADNTPVVGNLNLRNSGTIIQQQRGYGDVFTASWARQVTAPNFAVRYQDDTEWARIPGVIPATNMGFASWNNNANPDERGARIVAHLGCRIVGVWSFSVHVNATSTGDVKVYVNDDQRGVSAAPGTQRSNTNSSGRTVHWLPEPVFCSKGDIVRATIKATDASNNVGFNTIDLPNAAVNGALDMGDDCIYTSRNNEGSWTDSSLTRPWIGLIVDQLEVPSSPYSRSFTRRAFRSRA